jgi:hypothetical protein
MPNATSTLTVIFQNATEELTMPELLKLAPTLQKNEISMALCHLLKQKYLSRAKVDRHGNRGRKEIWSYKYHADRQKEQSNEQIEN